MSFTTKRFESDTLGGLLKKARLSRNLELKDVEKEINIEKKYLEFLEEDDFYKLPSSTYARGFLKRYTEFLGLETKKIIKPWEEKYHHQPKEFYAGNKKKKDEKKTFQRINFKIILFLLIFLLIIFYLGFSIKNVLLPPEIKIIHPPKEFVTYNSSLLIKGETEFGAEVFINHQAVEKKHQRVFEQKIELLPGLNIIEISAKKKHSKQNTILRQVVLE